MALRGRGGGGTGGGLRTSLVVDLVLLAPAGDRLALFAPADASGRRALPSGAPRAGEALDAAAMRLARAATGGTVAWLEQARTRTTSDGVSVLYVGLIPGPAADDERWIPRARAVTLGAAARHLVDEATDAIGNWLDRSPIAFRLLPPAFTLSDLQDVYEILLGRTLHKASFRRALQSARLVSPTKEWRSEGRGRPAQLFRLAPRARKSWRRGVRFDWLSE